MLRLEIQGLVNALKGDTQVLIHELAGLLVRLGHRTLEVDAKEAKQTILLFLRHWTVQASDPQGHGLFGAFFGGSFA